MNLGDIYMIIGLSIVTLFFGVMTIAMFDYEKKTARSEKSGHNQNYRLTTENTLK